MAARAAVAAAATEKREAYTYLIIYTNNQGCAILKFLILFGLQYSGDDFATPIPIMIFDKVE